MGGAAAKDLSSDCRRNVSTILASPIARVGEAQDIANGVLFLRTDAANYMTGQELVIDGGITAGGPPRRAS